MRQTIIHVYRDSCEEDTLCGVDYDTRLRHAVPALPLITYVYSKQQLGEFKSFDFCTFCEARVDPIDLLAGLEL